MVAEKGRPFPYFDFFISKLRYFRFQFSFPSFPYFVILFPYFAIFISSFLNIHFRFPHTQLEDLATNILCYQPVQIMIVTLQSGTIYRQM